MIRILAWLLISATTTATVYNAVPEQCNAQPAVTASGRRITGDVAQLRWLAMERTMMARYGINSVSDNSCDCWNSILALFCFKRLSVINSSINTCSSCCNSRCLVIQIF